MRKFIAILILAAAGYMAYTYLYVPLTDEERVLNGLEKRFDEASRALLSAERTMGATGLDATSDAEMAIRRVRQVENELKNLKPTLKEENSKRKAEELEAKILDFNRKVGLI